MALCYVGLVAPIDYPALYALCEGRLPAAFEEWRIVEDQARRELVAAGYHVVGLHVDVIALRDYCRSVNIRADAAALRALATNIGNREFATQREYAVLREQAVVVDDIRTGTVAEEEAAGGRLVAQTVPTPGRRWWQFWRRPMMTESVSVRTATIEQSATGQPVVVESPRRHWWQIWRRPGHVDAVRRQPTWRDTPRRAA
jgi:hypothetical protein